jgi:hypothetical protein
VPTAESIYFIIKNVLFWGVPFGGAVCWQLLYYFLEEAFDSIQSMSRSPKLNPIHLCIAFTFAIKLVLLLLHFLHSSSLLKAIH